MKESHDLEDLVELHRAFWRKGNHKPLLSVKPYTPLRKDEKIPLSDGRLVSDGVDLSPKLIDPKIFIRSAGEYKKSSLFCGDFIEVLAPYDLCWTQALIGCPIHVSSGTVWAKPLSKEITDLEYSSLKNDREWLEKLLEFTRELVDWSRGHYPVVQPLFRGPIDMTASALSPDKLCIAIYRYTKELMSFLDYCAQTFVDALKAQLEFIPRFHDGYSCIYGIWADKPICRDQADHSVLMSSRLYEKVFMPYDLKVINAFEYTVFHLHSANIHIARALTKIPNLRAIQVSIDYPAKAFSPSMEKLIPIFKEIQKSKPLIVTGPVTEDEMHLILDELSPEGLALKIYRLS